VHVHISFKSLDPASITADVLAFGVAKGLDGLQALDPAFGGSLATYAAANQFTGAAGTSLAVPGFGKIAAATLLLIGTGDKSSMSLAKAARKAGNEARTLGASSLVLALGDGSDPVLEAAAAGNYSYDHHKKESDRTPGVESLIVVGDGDASDASVRTRWQNWARDLVNGPAAEIYPESLGAATEAAMGALPGVEVEVWDYERLHTENCVGIIAVGRGSDRKPRMIRVTYRPEGATGHVALVGKGVTFDSGGLSLKPSGGMQTMRCDMGGSATMLAAIGAAAEMGLPLNIDCWVAAAENMVSGDSYKLGDILTYDNGVTVEVHNTDAEGRLVLADALIQACRVEGVTHLLDAATLTGACVVAVGGDFTGFFTHDEDLAASLSAASSESNEGFWRLPLHSGYKRMLKAEWAQIKNVGGREAGASTAALFLEHFVDGPAWAHLDIAGSSFYSTATRGYASGGTGEPVRTVVRWLEGMAK